MTTLRPSEIALFTFGEITANPAAGGPIDPAVRLGELIELTALADEAGLDVFGVVVRSPLLPAATERGGQRGAAHPGP